jgi:hypothetical protein
LASTSSAGSGVCTCTAPSVRVQCARTVSNLARAIAAGLRSVPLRPRNSARSPLTVRAGPSTSKKAVRPGNSLLYAFRAVSAPLFASISVITCIAVFGRTSPSTHSR